MVKIEMLEGWEWREIALCPSWSNACWLINHTRREAVQPDYPCSNGAGNTLLYNTDQNFYRLSEVR